MIPSPLRRGAPAVLALATLAAGALVAPSAGPAARAQAARPWVLDATWPTGDDDPIGLVGLPDGGALVVRQPRQTTVDYEALARVDATGAELWERVVRGGDGQELRPVAVAADPSGTIYLATADRLLATAADGTVVWEAAAGDAHPDFGPAARALALDSATALLYGTDLVRARLLSYRATDGQRRLRLGTQGDTPGSFSSPIDVALVPPSAALPLGGLHVAEYGNRRLQRLDRQGNPLGFTDLPARPRALADDPARGKLYALLEDETVVQLDLASGRLEGPILGGLGRGAGRSVGAWDLAVAGSGLLVADRGGRRIQRYRPPESADPAPTSTPTPFQAGASPIPPQSRQVLACPGRPAVVDVDVALPPAPPRADLLLVVDSTGSMESLISTMQSRAQAIVDGLRAQSGDLAIGLLDVRDAPYGEAGLASDWTWLVRGPLSTRPEDLAEAAAQLRAGGGGDAPESYAAAIAGALDSPLVGWRPDARRIVVILGDSVARDDDLNAAVPSPRVPGVWTPGRPTWWLDSGPDLAPGTADDLDWQALLDRLKAEGVTLVAGVTGAAPTELAGLGAELRRYWAAWASRAGPGGQAVDLGNVAILPQALASMFGAAGRRVERLAPRVSPPQSAAWVAVSPPEVLGLDVPPEGLTRRFTVTVDPPPGLPSGRYPVTVTFLGDGSRYAELDVDLDWRSECPTGPTPTASPSPPPSDTPEPTPVPRTATATASPTTRPSATATARPPTRLIHLPWLGQGFCLAARRPDLDVVLVLDASQSMAGAKLAAALAAAQGFVDLLALPRDHVALVSFHGRAQLEAGLTGTRSTLERALAAVRVSAGTRIDLGLAAAQTELRSPRARPGARPVLLLLTDGQPDAGTRDAALAAAASARAAGALVYAIGLGSDVDAGLLTGLAGGAERVRLAPAEADLAGIYRELAAIIPCR